MTSSDVVGNFWDMKISNLTRSSGANRQAGLNINLLRVDRAGNINRQRRRRRRRNRASAKRAQLHFNGTCRLGSPGSILARAVLKRAKSPNEVRIKSLPYANKREHRRRLWLHRTTLWRTYARLYVLCIFNARR